MKYFYLTSLILLLSLTSCGGKKQQIAGTSENLTQISTKEEPEINESEMTEFQDGSYATFSKQRLIDFELDFSNIEQFSSNLNKYVIKAELKTELEETTLSCETQSSPHDKKIFQKSFPSGSKTLSLLVDLKDITAHVETIKCELKSVNEVVGRAEFTMKKDILISKNGDLNKILVSGKNSFGTLVLAEGVVLETLGTNFDIQIDQLISVKAKITTFIETKTASNNMDGHSGGVLNINASVAYGDLFIEMRGQDGGLVTNVPAKIEERPIADPALFKGQDMIVEWVEYCQERDDEKFCQSAREATTCPSSGKNGIDGFKGRKAFNGRSGGNSGVANVNVGDGSHFDLDIKLVKGSGSLPGQPGEGGLGTAGGRPGSYNPAFISQCGNQIPSAGKDGSKGENGDSGIMGPHGQIDRASYIDLKNNLKMEY